VKEKGVVKWFNAAKDLDLSNAPPAMTCFVHFRLFQANGYVRWMKARRWSSSEAGSKGCSRERKSRLILSEAPYKNSTKGLRMSGAFSISGPHFCVLP